MLYLIFHAEPAVGQETALELLSERGVQQSVDLACLMESLKIQVVYAAPHRRALDTIKHFVSRRRKQGDFCRVEVHYELTNGVFTPERKPVPMPLEWAHSYGLNRQSVYGIIPGPENQEAHQRRVLDWFTNEFWPKYESAPIPTAIVADGRTLAVILYYIMANSPYAEAKRIVETLSHGAVLEFRGNGMRLEFSRRVN